MNYGLPEALGRNPEVAATTKVAEPSLEVISPPLTGKASLIPSAGRSEAFPMGIRSSGVEFKELRTRPCPPERVLGRL